MAVEAGLARLRLSNGAEIKAAAPASVRAGAPVTAVIRAQKLAVGAEGKAAGAMPGKVVSASYLGGTAAYFLDAGGLKLQAIATIDDRVWHDGEAVAISIAPADVLLLDESGRRMR